MQIPNYEEALKRHATPLDIFISRWEPVNHKSDKKTFREDLAALIAYIESAQHRVQADETNCGCKDEAFINDDTPGVCGNCGKPFRR